MNNAVAVIILDQKNRKIRGLSVTQKQFRFKCKRCAALCCKLGGPMLTKKDAEQIKNAGYFVKDFLEPITKTTEGLPLLYGNLKTREDGSCIFLQKDPEQNCFKCSIYDSRPALCRLYPFTFEKVDSNRIVLKIIPCCMGLNSPEGKALDKEFVSSHLLEPLLEAMESL